MSSTRLYIKEGKINYLARCGRIRKTAQGLWTTDSVKTQFEEENGAFIDGVPVGLGHIKSISDKVMDHTIEYTSMVMLIKNMKMNDEIVEEYPTVFCQDCMCPFPNTGSDIELNYNTCRYCGLTQFTTTERPEMMRLQLMKHKSHRQYNLVRIDLKIQEIGSRFAYRFLGIRAIISSARSKLLQFYKSVAKFPSGGDAFAGACFFAAVCEFRLSRFGRGNSPASLDTITLFASNSKTGSKNFGTKNKVSSDRILTLVNALILKGLCIDNVPELNRMLLWKKCIQKKITFKTVSEIGIRLENSNHGAVVVSEVRNRKDTNGLLKGDLIEKCNGVNIDANADVCSVLEIIKNAKLNGRFVLTIKRRRSRGKRKRQEKSNSNV